MSKHHLLALACLAALTACPGVNGATGGHDTPQAGILSGTVRGATGQPLGGVTVTASNTVYYNSTVGATSDASGHYRLSVPAGSWHATAEVKKTYAGRPMSFDLDPSSDAPFAGTDGATRDFTWRTWGPRPDGGAYGSPVIVYADPEAYDLDPTAATLTLTPLAPLLDGQTGQALTDQPRPTGDGDAIPDVPVTRYRVTAEDGNGQPLRVRARNTGDYAPSVDADFKPISDHRLSLEIQINH